MNTNRNNDNIPFCTKLFQVILTGALLATFISAMQIVASSNIKTIEYMNNFFIFAPLLLSVIIWYKIYNKSSLRMKYSGLRIDKYRISSSSLVYASIITIIFLILAMWDELLVHIAEFKTLPEFLSFAIENAIGYIVLISILSILSICLSISLKSEIHDLEVPILYPFVFLSISYYIYKFFDTSILDMERGEAILLTLSFLFYMESFRLKWNNEKKIDIHEFYWFAIFVVGFIIANIFGMLDILLSSWAILPIPLHVGSSIVKIENSTFIKAVKVSYIQQIIIIVSNQIHPDIEIFAFISIIAIIRFIYDTTCKKALATWIIYSFLVLFIQNGL